MNLKRGYFSDEGWYLLVASRLMDGDILYRDVMSHVTPLGHYISLIFTYVFGVEIWSLRIATSLIFLGNILLIFRVLKKLSLGIPYQLSAALLNLIYCPPGLAGSGTLYTPLAILFYLLCFDVTLSWFARTDEAFGRKREDVNYLAILFGISVGLTFVSKQNFGIYALVAFVLCSASNGFLYYDFKGHVRYLLTVSCSIVCTVAIILAPTYFYNGFTYFIEYVLSGFTIFKL